MGLFSWLSKGKGAKADKGPRDVLIDLETEDPVTNETVLVLVHGDDWSEDGREWRPLQERLNDYINVAQAYGLEGEGRKAHAPLPRIVVVSPTAPPRWMTEAMQKAGELVRHLGIRVSVRSQAEFMLDFGRPGAPEGR